MSSQRAPKLPAFQEHRSSAFELQPGCPSWARWECPFDTRLYDTRNCSEQREQVLFLAHVSSIFLEISFDESASCYLEGHVLGRILHLVL